MEAPGSFDDETQENGEDFDSSPDGKVIGDDFLMDAEDGDFDDDDDLIDEDMLDDEQEHDTPTGTKKVPQRTQSIEESHSKRH